MESIAALLVGIMAAVSCYLMLSGNLLRFLLGLSLIGNAVNLTIFAGGGMTYALAPLVEDGAKLPPPGAANALPQALILTAIVIGFGLLAFSLVLVYRYYGAFGTVEADEVDRAEPRD